MKPSALGALVLGLGLLFDGVILKQPAAARAACAPMGWYPTKFSLKDHSVFTYQNSYYVVANELPGESRFAYGRSMDLCTWETLPFVLANRTPNIWDSQAVWAPSVYSEGGLYYMYYTGVAPQVTQSIMLSVSTNPADSTSWQTGTLELQPNHPGMLWQAGQWADCRDPMLMKVGDTYYLYYTGLDQSGGIVGVATSASPGGPWYDWGAMFSVGISGGMPESPTVTVHDGVYYLIYNQSGAQDTPVTEHFAVGAGPTGPWRDPHPLSPGWADEVWRGLDNLEYISSLNDYNVNISRLTWDTQFAPAHPFIGANVWHTWMPWLSR